MPGRTHKGDSSQLLSPCCTIFSKGNCASAMHPGLVVPSILDLLQRKEVQTSQQGNILIGRAVRSA